VKDFRLVSVAYRDLVFDLAALVDEAHQDEAIINRLMRLAGRALDAVGLTLTELDGTPRPSGRVVAATGAATWALGRLVPSESVTACLRPEPPPYRIELNVLDALSVEQLNAIEAAWALVHPIRVSGRISVVLTAFFRAGQQIDADQTAVMKLIASAVGYLYRAGPASNHTKNDAAAQHELFMAVTSHELRTPLTVIKSYAETLRDHWDQLTDQQRRSSITVISQRSSDLARMVDRLLDATTSLPPLEQTPFDLTVTLHRAAADLSANLRKRLAIEVPDDLPLALGERASIPSVLIELVTNADKYSPGPAPIRLTAGFDRCTVFFQIADRGIGIPAGQAAHTFERFWQGDTGDDRRYGGAGLGLFLVRKTIERQNGWVSLRPRDGGGTVAEVRLPRGDIGVGEA
jgi:two-component system phosphate regulon sensor histidine kinase PhoR